NMHTNVTTPGAAGQVPRRPGAGHCRFGQERTLDPQEGGRRMTAAVDLLTDAFGRIRETVHEAVDGLTPEELAFRPNNQANSIAWLVWHLTRIQDDHIAGATETEQLWTSEGWADRFGLPLPPADHGYGHTA